MIFDLDKFDDKGHYQVLQLPGGEYHPKIDAAWGQPKYFDGSEAPLGQKWLAYIRCRLTKPEEVIKLITVTDAIKRRNDYREIHLITGYFPGGRQDRFRDGEAFTCKVYTDLINAQNYTSVSILDPHSDVTTALLNKVEVIPIEDHLKKIVEKYKYDTILIPDAGAAKKTFSYYFPDVEYNKNLNFVQCLKKRDTKTGKLSGFKVDGLYGKKYLIVDDIIDGGGTFIGLLKEIQQMPVRGKDEVGLFGTHGIFSKGTLPLLYDENGNKLFDKLFTTNSIREETEGVTTIKVI